VDAACIHLKFLKLAKKGCDPIVCWKHNWAECPLEVLELSKLVELPLVGQLKN